MRGKGVVQSNPAGADAVAERTSGGKGSILVH